MRGVKGGDGLDLGLTYISLSQDPFICLEPSQDMHKHMWSQGEDGQTWAGLI